MLDFYNRLSINRKIIFVGSCVFLFTAVIIILFSAITTYNTSIEENQKNLDLYAKHKAGEIYVIMNSVVKTAETFSSVVLTGEHQMAPRDQLSPVMMQILVDNPDFHGIYTIWEEHSIDGLESVIYIARDDDWNPQLVQVSEEYINNTLYFKDYYTIPKQTKQPALTDPYLGAEVFPPPLMVTVSAPILDDRVFKGIIGIDIALDNLNHFVEDAIIYDGRGRMILISNDGTIVGITEENSMVGESLEKLAPVFGVSADEIVAQFQRQNSAVFEIGEYIGVTNPVVFGNSDRPWSVVIIIPKSIQSERTFSLVLSLAIVGIIVLICGFFLLSMVANSITRPIKKLTEVAQAVASGDLSKRVNNDGFDEIAELGMAFDHMTSELQTTLDTIRKEEEKQIAVLNEVNVIARAASEGKLDVRGDPSQFSLDNQDVIKSINATLDALSNPLFEAMKMASAFASGNFSARFDQDIPVSGDFIPFKDSMDMIGIKTSDTLLKIRHGIHEMNDDISKSFSNVEEIASAVSSLAENSSSVSSLADRNDASIEQTLTAMNDLAETVSEVAQRTTIVSELANHSSHLAHDGVKQAELAEKGMGEIMETVDGTAKSVSDMSSHMDEIGGIVDTISGIAEQTNLLALNAAIEAARAGDAGLGFAVVADEVKSLAQESQTSAEHIVTIIRNLQRIASVMATGMEQASVAVQSGSRAVNETVTILQQMAESIADVNQNMGEVAAASEEQAASVQEITASLSEVRSMVQDTAREATDSAAAAEKINASLEQLKEASAESAELADMIAGKVNLFKIE